MAAITHSTRTTPRPYRSRKGSFTTWEFTCSTAISSAVIRYGDVVQFDVNVAGAANKIVKSSTMANVPNVLSSVFVGLAAGGSTGDGSTSTEKLSVILATPETEFLWPTKIAGADHGSSLIGSRRAIGYDSTLGMFYMDTANSTVGDASLVVTEVPDEGTTNGFIVGKFLSTATSRFLSVAF